MVRRSLFFGLTLALIAVVIFLMVQGSRQEKEPVTEAVEKIEEAVPSATRVLNPRDIEVALRKMEWEEKKDAAKPSYVARHEIEIQNRGKVPYREVGLRLSYPSQGGKAAETRTCSIVKTIEPGADVVVSDVRTDGFSNPVHDPALRVLYADIGGESPPKQ